MRYASEVREDLLNMSSGKIRSLDFVLLTLMVLLRTSSAVRINKLQVPKVIRHGAPVVLDCDFTIDETDQELVVKWFFNKNKTLVYQWIPEADNKPQGLGILRDRLNLGYEASKDERKRHRALHILKPGPDLSGDYTCSVSTVQNEDMRTKTMLVYVPEKSLRIRRQNIGEENMRVECIADGVFPIPTMALHSQKRIIPEPEMLLRRHGQLYEVSATTTLPILKDPEEFSCELKIPQANYTMRRETVFYPGNAANTVFNVAQFSNLRFSLLILWTTAYCSYIHVC